ncbi:hypothetical protein ACKUT9_05430 [Mycobacterium seoulense]|uniref:hypothetical protein n=1 Tax=Mycobacterium seoulense TaxID=386911 RepID=UPI003CFB6AA5
MKRLALSVTAPALLLAACGGATDNSASSVASAPAAGPKTVIDTHGRYWPIIDNDGTYLVGVDVLAGKYRNAGGAMCYWARLRSLDPGDVIESRKTAGPQSISIQASDTAFLTRDCGTWQATS